MKLIKWLLIALICGNSILSYSQQNKFKISLQGGFMDGGSIYNNQLNNARISGKLGWNAGADISYFLTKRFFISAHFNSGQFSYLTHPWDRLSETYYRMDEETHGEMKINTIGLLAGYCLPMSQSVLLTGQIGFSQFIQIDNYPVITYFPDQERESGFREETWNTDFGFFSAAFPVKFGIGFSPFKKINIGFFRNVEIGYVFGFYIEPDFGVFTGIYHGPQLSVSF
jgi:hypothetical protein